MRMRLFCRGYRPSRQGQRIGRRLGWLAGVWVLAMGLLLVSGVGQAQAASAVQHAAGGLVFTQPNYRGVIGGPPGTKVTVQGSAWIAYSSVDLSLTNQVKNCSNAVSVGTFATDKSGSFIAKFIWPAAANQVGAYYACGTQANKGTGYSHNAFSVLSSSPASLSFTPTSVAAGDTITLSGSNWLPAPQTINIVVVPCQSLCAQPPVAQLEVVTDYNGAFSQQMTISASAATAGYYIQATNSLAVIAATAGPLQVTGQAAPGGTPSVVATHTTQTGVVPPPSNTKTALKDALLAGGLGLLALLVLLGVVVFFLTRARRGPDLAASSKSSPTMDNRDDWLEEDRFSSRRATISPEDDDSAYLDMPQLPPSRHHLDESWDDEEQHAPAAAPPYEEYYPWTRNAENTEARDLTLPAQQPPIDDATYLAYLPQIQRRSRRPGVPPRRPPPDYPSNE